VGVYAGYDDKVPLGAVMNRSLPIKTGHCHVHRYMEPLLEHIQNGDIDPSLVITHRWRWKMRRWATTSSITRKTTVLK
jgi:threonine dehydrogenase-like Zn-dependent dehydrogenase